MEGTAIVLPITALLTPRSTLVIRTSTVPGSLPVTVPVNVWTAWRAWARARPGAPAGTG